MSIGYIYKITSPTGRIYIGQTINWKKRFSDYKCNRCKTQIKLSNSLTKYGWAQHSSEIIHKSDLLELNKWERYYQELFESTGPNGLNLRLTSDIDRSGKHSDESKQKMSISRKSFISERRSLGLSAWTPEQRDAILAKRKANPYKRSKEVKEAARIKSTGKKHSEYSKNKIRLARIGGTSWNKGKSADEIPSTKLLFNNQTGIYYHGTSEAFNSLGQKISKSYLQHMINGRYKNKTSLVRV